MKVLHHGFNQVKNAHTKIDRLIKVKLCILHMNSNDVFIEDRTSIIVWHGCRFCATLSVDINRISTLFLIFSNVLPKTELLISLKKSTSKLFPDFVASILSFVFRLMYSSSEALSSNLISLWIFVIFKPRLSYNFKFS